MDYRSFVNSVAKVIAVARSMTDEEWTSHKNQVIKDMELDPDEFTNKLLSLIDKYRHNPVEMGKVLQMNINDIKIFPCYASHPPKWEKMQRKEQFYRETGLFQSEITVDAAGNLLNGYTSYLLAKAAGVEDIPVRVIRRQIVRAHHRRSGKLYAWKLPESLTGQVYAGDRLVVQTGRGLQTVTVAMVEEYTGQEPEPSRMAIRKRKVVSKGGALHDGRA